MDEATLERMVSRLAGGPPAPDVDPLSELVQLVGECRNAMGMVAAGVLEGRLSEEVMSRLWRSLNDRARSACEGIRSCKKDMEALLPRTEPGRTHYKEAPLDALPW